MNDSGKFEDRWVYLKPQTNRCVFIDPERRIYLPIAHAEGKIVTNQEEHIKKLKVKGHIAFTYVDAHGREGGYPVNPNGSMGSVAGLTDTTGRVLGLMPHPERFIKPTHHPRWTRLKDDIHCDGMIIFNQAVSYVQDHLLVGPVIK
jgi:phosphoribosylformylglycinamidine synthase